MDPASKAPQQVRTTDRVVEALVTLAALLDRTINEVKSLDSDFQSRLLQAVNETELSLQNQAAQNLEVTLKEARAQFEGHLKNRLAEISGEWEAERTRFNNEIDRLSKAAGNWETERARLIAELAQLSRVQAATQMEAEKAFAAAKAATAANKPGSVTTHIEVVNREMERVENLVREITLLIEDPTTELSAVIRKNVERAELESYLKGLRFALNGAGRK